MHFVAEVVIVVACGLGIVDIGEDRGVGNAGEERVAAAKSRLMGDVRIKVVLLQREVAPLGMQPYGGQIVADIRLQNTRRELLLVLSLARQLAVRTAEIEPLREQTVVETHAREGSVEREAAILERLGAADVPVHQ